MDIHVTPVIPRQLHLPVDSTSKNTETCLPHQGSSLMPSTLHYDRWSPRKTTHMATDLATEELRE